MSISKKDLKDCEEKYISSLYEKSEKIISQQSDIISSLKEIGQYIDIDTDLNNIGITFNNKLTELHQIFKKSGTSMFAIPNEQYDFIESNFVGDAIIDDMLSKLFESNEALSQCNSTIKTSIENRIVKVQALTKTSPLRKFFLKIRSFFNPRSILEQTSYSKSDIENVNSYISKYKEIDTNLFNYNLKDNVVQSLVSYIQDQNYLKSNIPLEESIIPMLQQLGLNDIIPQLKDAINKLPETPYFNDKSWELGDSQKLKIQISTEKVIKDYNHTNNDIPTKENIDYIEK